MNKVLFTATVDSHILAFHIPYLQYFKENGWEVHVASLGDSNIPFCDHKLNIPFNRSPFSFHNINAYKQLKQIIDSNRYNIIHCHMPVGGVITRLAARKSRKHGSFVVYTAHGFHFYKGAPFINWLLYYPIEKLLSNFTDILITINKEDYARAQSFHAKKVYYIPGVGVNVDQISHTVVNRLDKRRSLGIPEDAIVIVSAGELNKNKNQEMIIKAMSALNEPRCVYVICGQGDLEQYLRDTAIRYGVEDRVYFLGFRTDMIEILKASDIFVMPSYREGLPLALMEAMAVGLPVVCSKIRGNVELINENGGYLVEPNDIEGFVKCIKKLINDKELRISMGTYNMEAVKQFDLSRVKKEMNLVYERYQAKRL